MLNLWGLTLVAVISSVVICSLSYNHSKHWKNFLCVSNREDVERRFDGKLSKHMSGSLYEMVSRVMKALVNRKITVPGNFQG